MDFERSDDQELLARDGAPLPRRAGADLAVRPRPARRRPRHDRTRSGKGSATSASSGSSCPRRTAARAWAWSTSPSCSRSWAAFVHPGPYLVERGRRGQPRRRSPATTPTTTRCLPGLASGDTRRHRRALGARPTRAVARAGDDRDADGDAWRLDGTKVHVPDAVGADLVSWWPRATRRRARRVRGRRRTTPGVTRHRDADRRRHPQGGDGRRSTGAEARRHRRRRRRPTRSRRPSTGSASRWWSTASAPRHARSSSRSSTPRSASSSTCRSGRSRPCSTSAPTCCASVELARAARVLRVLGRATRPTPRERHRAATMAQAFAADALYEVGATRDPGVRRRRLHVGARHPPVLQAPAHAAAATPAARRSARGARHDRARLDRLIRRAVVASPRPATTRGSAAIATAASTTSVGSAGTRNAGLPVREARAERDDDRRDRAAATAASVRRLSTTTPPIANASERVVEEQAEPGDPLGAALALRSSSSMSPGRKTPQFATDAREHHDRRRAPCVGSCSRTPRRGRSRDTTDWSPGGPARGCTVEVGQAGRRRRSRRRRSSTRASRCRRWWRGTSARRTG